MLCDNVVGVLVCECCYGVGYVVELLVLVSLIFLLWLFLCGSCFCCGCCFIMWHWCFVQVRCLTLVVVLLVIQSMDQRDDAVMAAALLQVARAVQNLPNAAADVESRNLDMFMSCNPPKFMGTHEPDGAQDWLKRIEKIFRLVICSEEQKVVLGAHMLEEEAEDWWSMLLNGLEMQEL